MKKALMIIKMLQKYRKYNKAAVVIRYRYVYRKIHFHILKAVDFHRFKSFFFYYKHQKRKRKEKLHERDIEYWFNDKSNNNKKNLNTKKMKIEN